MEILLWKLHLRRSLYDVKFCVFFVFAHLRRKRIKLWKIEKNSLKIWLFPSLVFGYIFLSFSDVLIVLQKYTWGDNRIFLQQCFLFRWWVSFGPSISFETARSFKHVSSFLRVRYFCFFASLCIVIRECWDGAKWELSLEVENYSYNLGRPAMILIEISNRQSILIGCIVSRLQFLKRMFCKRWFYFKIK